MKIGGDQRVAAEYWRHASLLANLLDQVIRAIVLTVVEQQSSEWVSPA
ncbi:hypothetical protein [Mycolicibacterium sp.]|nr:hypothetical protein [Mycolicibacterium sp.]